MNTLTQALVNLADTETAKSREINNLYKALIISNPTLEQMTEARSNLDKVNGRLEMLSEILAIVKELR